MKIGWGTKIILLYGGFVVMILILVVMSSMQKFHLVTEDYYGEELKYEDRIEKMRNSQALTEKVQIRFDGAEQMIFVQFPKDKRTVSGSIHLYRPADADQDVMLEIGADAQNRQAIYTRELSRGYWKVLVEWKSDGVEYFEEVPLMVQ
jgi:hypothetical protein